MLEALKRRYTELGLRGLSDPELTFIAATVQRARPDFIAEWGTNSGSSARVFYELAQLLELDCDLYSIDISDGLRLARPEDEGLARGHFALGLVELHVGDGAPTALELYGRRSASVGRRRPLFYLDGDHSEEAVLAELVALSTHCLPAALLLHDTSREPGAAARLFLDRFPGLYVSEVLESEHGMMALWPR